MEQQSEEWFEFRKKKIGASDTPIILGISPYKKPYELWLEKTGRKENPPPSESMRYGNYLEPEVRKRFEEELGEPALPKVIKEGPEGYEFMMASLDGITIDDDILEIKCCNKEVFEMAKNGEVAKHYYAQIQHQLFCVPEADLCYYYCYHKGETALVRVKRDEEYLNDMLHKISEFWDHVQNDVPPPLMEDDCLLIEDDPEFEKAAIEWRKAKAELDKWKKLEADAKKNLLDCTDDGNCLGYGVIIKKSYRKVVEYKKACEEALIDTSKYEKTSISWSIKESKGNGLKQRQAYQKKKLGF